MSTKRGHSRPKTEGERRTGMGPRYRDPNDPAATPVPTHAAIRLSKNEVHRARLFVCSQALVEADGAVDVAVPDARFLLDVLGLR